MIISGAALAAVTAAFLASLVEVTEAYTIVLAGGFSRGWRSALTGMAAALVALAVIVVALGPLLDRIPLAVLQFPIGLLILLFGLGWLRKAILRAGGVLALHDEDAIFAREMHALGGGAKSGFDAAGMLTAFQGVLLEGLEVVFIVIAVGAGRGLLIPASAGAAAACAAILLIGAAIHKPLSRVPENSLKFAVGIMLSSFGVFWLGEAMNVPWPVSDFALLYLAAAFLALSLVLVRTLRSRDAAATRGAA
jgi:uncharacterized membrane protein